MKIKDSNILTDIYYKLEKKESIKNFDVREKEINKLYHEFLNNYMKLNDSLGFKNPLEIGGMYVYALVNGYLSENETFEFTTKHTNIVANNNALYIFTGQGCCRHISRLLRDVYKKEKIESYSLCTYVDTRKKEEHSFYKKRLGNHVINLAYYNNEVYFFDPTNIKVYRKNFYSDSILVNGKDKILMKQNTSIIINNKIEFESLKERLSYNFEYIDLDKQYQIINNTFNICRNNDTKFISFYKQNKDLYHKINEKTYALMH